MKNFRLYLLGLGLVFALFAILSLRPVPAPGSDNYRVVTGQISELELTGGPDDIFLSLSGEDRRFYINRGAALLDISTLKAMTDNRMVTLYYSNHWTPLDPGGKTRHLYALEVDGERLYDEFK